MSEEPELYLLGHDPAAVPEPSPTPSTLRTFLESASPFNEQTVSATIKWGAGQFGAAMPKLLLYCDNSLCGRDSFFDPIDTSIGIGGNEPTATLAFVRYRCRFCRATVKTYALQIKTDGGPQTTLQITKFGEDPAAVGPTPRSLKNLLSDQWVMYLSGRRAELHGLGIGAFVYYRRAIEQVWQRVLQRLLEVARLEDSPDRIRILTAATAELGFTRSMDIAKGAVPTSLFVDGHNPFQALYDACGDGIHEYTDEECIVRARIIRLVLGRFAERAKAVLAEDTEFRAAVGALAGRTS